MINCAAGSFVRHRPLCIALRQMPNYHGWRRHRSDMLSKKNAVLEGQVRDTKPAAKRCCRRLGEMSVNCSPSYDVTGYKAAHRKRSLLSHVTASSTNPKEIASSPQQPKRSSRLPRLFPHPHKVLLKLRIKKLFSLSLQPFRDHQN